MSEKINKNERKNKAEIITEMMGSETNEFWIAVGEKDGKPTIPIKVNRLIHSKIIVLIIRIMNIKINVHFIIKNRST